MAEKKTRSPKQVLVGQGVYLYVTAGGCHAEEIDTRPHPDNTSLAEGILDATHNMDSEDDTLHYVEITKKGEVLHGNFSGGFMDIVRFVVEKLEDKRCTRGEAIKEVANELEEDS